MFLCKYFSEKHPWLRHEGILINLLKSVSNLGLISDHRSGLEGRSHCFPFGNQPPVITECSKSIPISACTYGINSTLILSKVISSLEGPSDDITKTTWFSWVWERAVPKSSSIYSSVYSDKFSLISSWPHNEQETGFLSCCQSHFYSLRLKCQMLTLLCPIYTFAYNYWSPRCDCPFS